MKQYLDDIKKFRPIDDTFMQVLFKDNEKLVKKSNSDCIESDIMRPRRI